MKGNIYVGGCNEFVAAGVYQQQAAAATEGTEGKAHPKGLSERQGLPPHAYRPYR
jgi:hypothetical protein